MDGVKAIDHSNEVQTTRFMKRRVSACFGIDNILRGGVQLLINIFRKRCDCTKHFSRRGSMTERVKLVLLSVLLCLSILVGCNGDSPSPSNPEQAKGSIEGTVVYSASSGNEGITITVEGFDEKGVSRGVCGQTSTTAEGKYSVGNLDAGLYTVYASSQNSSEKAVTTNVTVEVGKSVTAATLRLSPVGSIRGSIVVDGKSTDLTGYTIFVPSTSYIALTGSDGSFALSDIPEGSYPLFVMKNGKSGLFYTASVRAGELTSIGSIQVYSMIFGFDDANSFVWKGSLYSHPDFPQENWAYYNLSEGRTYIYANGKWSLMSDSSGVKITWRGSLPSEPSQAQLYDAYFNTIDGCSYIFTGTEWSLISAKGGKGDKGDQGLAGLDGMSIVWKGALPAPMDDPQELWTYYNTTDGCSYIYSNGTWSLLASRGASIVWLGSFDREPADPLLYNAYYNTMTGCSYIFDGEAWTLLAAKGDAGQDGQTGATGATGASGADGTSIIWKGSYMSESDIPDPQELWAYYNTSNGCSYIFSGGTWNLLASSSSVDRERTMIVGTVKLEDAGFQPGVYVTATLVDAELDQPLIYKTYTNKDGNFAFSNLKEGAYLISVSFDGYISKTADTVSVKSGSVSRLGELELELEKGVFYGYAKLSGSSDCSGIKVSIIGTDYSCYTDVDGLFRIQIVPGEYVGGIKLEKKNFETSFASSSFVVRKNETTSISTLDSPIVLNPTKVDVVYGVVKVVGRTDNSGITVELIGPDNYSTTTDAYGNWAVEDVLIGEYTVVASVDGSSDYVSQVSIGGEQRKVNLRQFNVDRIVVEKPIFSVEGGTYDNDVTLSISAQSGVDVFYTLDGAEPKPTSLKYSIPLTISKDTVVKAVAAKGSQMSDVVSAKYILKVGDVVVNEAGGYYDEAKGIELTTSTTDAQIYYTMDGSTPNIKSKVYSAAIEISEDVTIKAVAMRTGYNPSNSFEARYTFNKPKNPTFSIASGTYEEGCGVSLSSSDTLGAVVYYTTDGRDPVAHGRPYTSQIALEKNMTIKAYSRRKGLSSSVVSAEYRVKVSAPKASLSSGTYNSTQTIGFHTDSENAKIYYTTNGQAPTTASKVYTSPIVIDCNTELKAMAVKEGLMSSDTVSYSYVIDNQSSGIAVTDPELRSLSIKLPDGWKSNMTVNKGTGEYLYAELSPKTNEALYAWYIDGILVSGDDYLCLGSWQDRLGVGSHMIRLEVKVGSYVYMDNLLLKVSL